MKDLLEQLAELEVREPPPDFDRQLHQRLNRSLLAQHVVDLLLGGVPWAVGHFVKAVLGWFELTMTGKWGKNGRGEGL